MKRKGRASLPFKLGLAGLLVSGIAFIVAGVALMSLPVALIVLGLCLTGLVLGEVYL